MPNRLPEPADMRTWPSIPRPAPRRVPEACQPRGLGGLDPPEPDRPPRDRCPCAPAGIGGRLACPAVPTCLPPPCPPVGAGGLVDPLPEPRVVVVEGLAAVVAVDAAPSGGLCPSPGDPLC